MINVKPIEWRKAMKNILLIFLIVFRFIIALFLILPAYDWSKCTERTTATITAYDDGYVSFLDDYMEDFSAMPHTTILYCINDETYEFRTIGFFGEIGDVIEIRYNPNNKTRFIVPEGKIAIFRILFNWICSIVAVFVALWTFFDPFLTLTLAQNESEKQSESGE